MALFFQFLVGHALGDYVLQRDMMATAKNRRADIYKSAGAGFPGWYYWLISHALIHGGAVFLVSGSTLLGVIETILHSIIDFGKCEKWFGIHSDQALHILCKVIYVYVIYQGWV